MALPVEIIVPVAFFITVFGIVYIVSTLRHKERIAMIENGIDADMLKPTKKKNGALRLGMLSVGAAIGVFVGYILEDFAGMDDIVYYASTLFFSGISLLASHFIEKGKLPSDDEETYF